MIGNQNIPFILGLFKKFFGLCLCFLPLMAQASDQTHEKLFRKTFIGQDGVYSLISTTGVDHGFKVLTNLFLLKHNFQGDLDLSFGQNGVVRQVAGNIQISDITDLRVDRQGNIILLGEVAASDDTTYQRTVLGWQKQIKPTENTGEGATLYERSEQAYKSRFRKERIDEVHQWEECLGVLIGIDRFGKPLSKFGKNGFSVFPLGNESEVSKLAILEDFGIIVGTRTTLPEEADLSAGEFIRFDLNGREIEIDANHPVRSWISPYNAVEDFDDLEIVRFQINSIEQIEVWEITAFKNSGITFPGPSFRDLNARVLTAREIRSKTGKKLEVFAELARFSPGKDNPFDETFDHQYNSFNRLFEIEVPLTSSSHRLKAPKLQTTSSGVWNYLYYEPDRSSRYLQATDGKSIVNIDIEKLPISTIEGLLPGTEDGEVLVWGRSKDHLESVSVLFLNQRGDTKPLVNVKIGSCQVVRAQL